MHLLARFVILTASVACFDVHTAAGHTLEEVKKELGDVPEAIAKITDAYEKASRPADVNTASDPGLQGVVKAQRNALREQLHAAQHGMLADHQKAQLKMKCVELIEKMHALERAIPKFEKAGKLDDLERAELAFDKARAFTTVNCVPPMIAP